MFISFAVTQGFCLKITGIPKKKEKKNFGTGVHSRWNILGKPMNYRQEFQEAIKEVALEQAFLSLTKFWFNSAYLDVLFVEVQWYFNETISKAISLFMTEYRRCVPAV